MKTKTTHTPGPWHTGQGLAARIIYAANGWAVADAKLFHFKHGIGDEVSNARLIAAAPDLLEAIQLLILPKGTTFMAAVEKARAAIKKATGE